MEENISLLNAPSSTESLDNMVTTDNNVKSNGEATNAAANVSKYWLDDKTPIEGEMPEWFNSKKYKTVSAQAAAQRELEKKLGSFIGAPEVYVPPENFEPDELYAKVASVAKELNMSNDALNKLVGVYLDHNNSNSQISNAEIEAHKITEMNKLGVNGQDMIKDVRQWITNNFSEDERTIFDEFAISADAIKVLAKIKDMTGKAMAQSQPVANFDNQSNFENSEEHKLEQMLLDPRYKTDTKYFDYVQEKYKQYYS